MSSKWPVVPIKELCKDVNVGFVGPSTKFRDDEGIPFLMGKNVGSGFLKLKSLDRVSTKFHNANKKSQLRGGDVVVVRIGNSGQACTIPDDFGEANCAGLVIIKQPSRILAEYLTYYLNSPIGRSYSMSQAIGSTRSTLNTSTVANTLVPLPPLDEQKRIVAKLDETLADLDKVTANAKGSLEEIDALWSSYLSEVFYSTSISTEKPTESTWNSEKLQNVCAFFNDGNWIELKDQSDEGYRLIQTGNIGEGIYKSNDHRARYVSKETFEKLKCTEVFPGDVLISRLPDPIGRACRVPEMLEPCITGVDCTILRFKDDVIPEIFVYFSQTSNYLDAVNKMAGGTTRQRISRKNLGEIEFPVPPIEDQKQIITRLNAQQKVLEEMRNVKRKTLRDSEQLRSSILAAAFAGDF